MKNFTMCSATIYRDGGGWGGRACSRRASIDRNGKWFCKTHDPVAKKERSQASYEVYSRKTNVDIEISNIRAEIIRRASALPEFAEVCQKLDALYAEKKQLSEAR